MAVPGINNDVPQRRQSRSSLPGGSNHSGSPSHRRTYQACIPCRRRKVRCDLGSVDDPHDPPCVRCRRESKECFFSATRRKRQHADATPDGPDGEVGNDYEARNARKRRRGESYTGDDLNNAIGSSHTGNHGGGQGAQSSVSSTTSTIMQHPLTPGGSVGQAQPLRRPTLTVESSISPQTTFDGDHFHQQQQCSPGLPAPTIAQTDAVEEEQQITAEKILQTGIYSGHDALNLLFEAAGRSGDITNSRDESQVTLQPPPVPTNKVINQPVERTNVGSGRIENIGHSYLQNLKREDTAANIPIDPAISGGDTSLKPPADDASQSRDYQDARRAWSSCSFYKYMAPLTPISPPSFQLPGSHSALLTEEPILAVTLLTISSRYMRLSGPGALSRSYAIHEKLWNYLRGMIERIVWGQEQFGAGFGTSPTKHEENQTSSTAPWRGLRKGSMRTLGTVESLMLLTEWHPRALHFPPGDDGMELIVHDARADVDSSLNELAGELPSSTQQAPRGVGGRRIESWLEPAWRSDRMCWMLLGNALALSFELGVFDPFPNMGTLDGSSYRPEYRSPSHRLRARRLRKLLLVYLTQLSGRLEWPNPCDTSDLANFKLQTHLPEGQPNPDGSATFFEAGTEDCVLHCWVELTNLMRSGNELFFSSRNHTKDLIRSGLYTNLLEHFQPRLRKWREEFDSFDIPKYMRYILEIEFEYLTVYINSLALQAVVERCANGGANNNASSQNLEPPGMTTPEGFSPRSRAYAGNIPYSTVAGLYGGDQGYIKEVVDASRNLLRTVVDGLLPGGYLQHAPVRTYFRIVSGAMFLLKTFALGAKEDEVALSLGLMDSTVQAMRTCVVDDVHLGIRFADLLDVLTQRIRSRFVRMAALGNINNNNNNNNNNAAVESRSRSPIIGPNGNVLRTSAQQQWQSTIYNNPIGSSGGGNNGYLNHTTLDGRSTPNPNPALIGIATSSIDPSDVNISIMPPPSFIFTPASASAVVIDNNNNNSNSTAHHEAQSYTAATATTTTNHNNNNNNVDDANPNAALSVGEEYVADWLALPLDPLLNTHGGPGFTQTSLMGPDVGGFDLLEILLAEMEEGVHPVVGVAGN
ncbi:MAG: hypothetical protein M1816_000998 [Peltula sp. TS41687]|nr:MAG: hypothetical protein M1816_000998 [Peltula sp. TS41687]